MWPAQQEGMGAADGSVPAYNLPRPQDCYLGQSPSFSCPPPSLRVTGTQGPTLPPQWPAVALGTVSGTPRFVLQPVTKPLFCWGEDHQPFRTGATSLQPGTMGSHGAHSVSHCGIKCHKVRTKREPRALMGLLLPAGQRIQPIV